MNRKQFMEELSQLLIGISEEERVEALQYYEDYFDDAGAENEQQVIEELGTPQKVASTICLNLEPGSEQNGEFTESGFQDEPIHIMKLLESRIIIVLIITWDKGRNHGRARH